MAPNKERSSTTKPQRGFVSHSAAWTTSQAQRFVFCGAKRTHLPNGQEEQAQTLVNEGCAYNQALAKLEIRPQNLRGNTCGQNGARQYKGKGHHWEAVTKAVKLGNTKEREKSAAQLRQVGTWTQSIAKVFVTRDAHEQIVKPGATLRPL